MAFTSWFTTLLVTVGLDLFPLSFFYFRPHSPFCNDCHNYLKRPLLSVTSDVHGEDETDSFGWMGKPYAKKRKNSEKLDQFYFWAVPSVHFKTRIH